MYITSYRTARLACALIVAPSLLISVTTGCRSTPSVKPPSPIYVPPPALPAQKPDTLSADLSPAIRAHLLKLRELRDSGVITDGDYQSRKASLVNR